MKNLKKDNKGFSLVELIVVVLIMAIIAVALAPQILKWVNNSRISADNNTMQQIVTNAQNALTDEKIYAKLKDSATTNDIIIYIHNNYSSGGTEGVSNDVTPSSGKKFSEKFFDYCGVTDQADFLKNFKVKQSDTGIKVTISHLTGSVKGEFVGTGANASIDN